jgi:hypothetical protein
LWGKYLSAEQTDAGPFFLVENERSRIVAFEADGKDFIIVVGGDGADGYAGALALGLPTIESLTLPSVEAPAE